MTQKEILYYIVIDENKHYLGKGIPNMFGKSKEFVLTSNEQRAHHFQNLDEAKNARKFYLNDCKKNKPKLTIIKCRVMYVTEEVVA